MVETWASDDDDTQGATNKRHKVIWEEPTYKQLQLIYHNARDLIFLYRVEGVGSSRVYRCESVNKTFLRRFDGIAGAMGKLASDIFPSGDYTYLKKHYDIAVDQQHPYNYETKTILDGETSYIDTTLVPIMSKGVCTPPDGRVERYHPA